MQFFSAKPKTTLTALLVVSAFLLQFAFLPEELDAAPNYEINYQGKLLDSANVPVEDGAYNMRFWLLTSPSIATTSAVWSEELTDTDKVQVSNGLFSVMLGSTSPLSGVDFNQTLYLGVEIGGTSSPAWDGEMSPRKILGTVPAAFYASSTGYASTSNYFDGLDSWQFLRSDTPTTLSSTSAASLFTVIQSGAGDIMNLFFDSTEVFTVTADGRVGIGSSSPIAELSVGGDMALIGGLYDNNSTRGTNGQLLMTTGSGVEWTSTSTLGVSAAFSNSAELAALLSDETGTGGNAVFSLSPTLTGLLSFQYASGTALTTSGNAYFGGRVGIGTTTPAVALQVGDGNTTGTSNYLRIMSASGHLSGIQLRSSSENYGFTFQVSNSGTPGLNLLRHENSAAGTSAFWINRGTGYIGVGTTSPTSLFTLESSDGPDIELRRPNQSHWKLAHTNNGFAIQNNWGDTGYGDVIAIADGSGRSGFGPSLTIDSSANAIFNESANDQDFRIESDTDTHAFFLEGSSGNIGIGSSSPYAMLTVASTSASARVFQFRGAQNSKFEMNAGTLVYTSALSAQNAYGLELRSTSGDASPHLQFVSASSTSKIYIDDATSTAQVGTMWFDVAGYNTLKLRKGDNRQGNVIISSTSTDDTYNDASLLVRNRWDGAPGILLARLSDATTANLLKVTAEDRTTPFFDITASGRVGIGTSTPQYTLSLDSASGASTVALQGSSDARGIVFSSGSSGNIGPTITMDSTNDWNIYNQTLLNRAGTTFWAYGMRASVAEGDDFFIGNSSNDSTPEFVIDRTTGNVGLASTSPSARLTISNTVATAANTPLFTIASTTGGTATSTLMTVLASGNVGIGTAAPGASLDVRANTAQDGIWWRNNAGTVVGQIGADGGGIGRLRIGSGSTIQLMGAGTSYFTGGNVGIGTSTAPALLTVQSSGSTDILNLFETGGTEVFTVLESGNVGIGTTSPNTKVSIAGTGLCSTCLPTAGSASTGGQPATLFLSDSGNAYGLLMGTRGDGASYMQAQRIDGNATLYPIFLNPLGGNVAIGTSTTNSRLSIQTSGTTDILNLFETGGVEVFTVLESGNVGIGSTSPNYALDVDGDINASGSIYINGVPVGTGSGSVSSVDMTVPTGFSISGNPITTAGTLALEYAAGYEGLLSASSTNWNSFFDTPSTRITAGTGLSWAGNTLNALGDGVSNWSYDGTRLMPTTTTAGLRINASSTIGDGTGAGGLTILGNATTTGNINLATNASTIGMLNNAAIRYSSSNIFEFLFSGANRVQIGSSYVNLNSAGVFGWSSGSNGSATFDTGLVRLGATSVGVGNGSANDVSGTLVSRMVGVGSTSPSALLTVANTIGTAANTPLFTIASTTGGTATSTLMTVLANGNVGIGIAAPQEKLSVRASSLNTQSFTAYNSSGALNARVYHSNGNGGLFSLFSETGLTDERVRLFAGGSSYLNGGNVGIGTTTPASLLTVAGNIGAANITATGTITGANGSFTAATSTNLQATTLGVGSDYITDITGSGLAIVGGALTATGDGVSNWLFDGLTLTPSSTPVGVTLSGTSTIATTTVTGSLSANRILSGDGIISAPGYGFTGDSDIGFYRNGNNVYTTVNSVAQFVVSNSGVGLTSSGVIGFSPNAVAAVGGPGLSRIASGVLGIGNGTQGDFTGTLVAGAVGVGSSSPSALLTLSNSVATAANTPLFTIASTTGGTSTSTLMTVLASGNVGIGTSSPGSKFSVQGSGVGSVHIGTLSDPAYGAISVYGSLASSGNYNFASSLNDPTLYINRPTGGDLYFREANGIAQLIVKSGGNVGIGTTTPNTALNVVGGQEYDGGTTGSLAAQVRVGTVGENGGIAFARSGDGQYTGSIGINALQTLQITNSSGSGNIVLMPQGNVGIGIAAPNYKLEVSGSASTTNLYATNGTTTNATSTTFRTATLGIGSDYLTDITGSGLTLSAGALTCATATGAVFGCLTAADWTSFNNKVSSTSIDTSAELAALLTNETGTGSFVLSTSSLLASPTIATGLTLSYATGGVLTTNGSGVVSASTTVGDSYIADGLTLSGGTIGSNNISGTLTTTGTLTIGDNGDAVNVDSSTWDVSAGVFSGIVGLTATNATTTAATSTNFRTTTLGVGSDYITDITGSGLSIVGGALTATGDGVSNWLYNGSRLSPSTTVGIGVFASSTIGGGTGATGLTIYGGATTTGNAYFGGNVGIGTTSPGSILHVESSLPILTLNTNTTGNSARINFRSNNTLMSTLNSDFASTTFNIFHNGGVRLLINNTGNIGIGTTTPAQLLSIAGGMHLTGALYDRTYNSGTNGMVLQTTGTGVQWVATSSLGFGSGDGSVSSVDMTVPTGFTIAGNPITTSGTLALSYAAGYEGLLSASSTNWNSFYNTPSTRITDGTGLTWSGNTLNCDTASGSTQGCLTAADWTSFNNKVSSTSIDTSAELAALLTNETGTAGNVVFSVSPTFTGTPTFSNLYVSPSGSTTLGYASSTALTVSGTAYLASAGLQVGSSVPFSDSAGTLTLQNIDALDATTESTIEAAIDTLGTVTLGTTTISGGTLTISNGAGASAQNTVILAPAGWSNPGPTASSSVNGTKINLFTSVGSNSNQIGMDGSGNMWFRTGGSQASGFAWYTASDNSSNPTSRMTLSNGGLLSVTYASSTGISGTNLNFTNATTTALRTTTLGVGSDYLTDITGSGLSIVGGALTASGDGVSNWSYDGTRLMPTTTTAGLRINASSTIGDGTGAGGLTVFGGATTTGNAYFGGNVGIGTSSPNSLLTLESSNPVFTISTLGGTYPTMRFARPAQNTWELGMSASNPAGANGFRIYDVYDNRTPFAIGDGALDNSLIITSAGNVAVGTTTASSKLTVAGNIGAANLTATGTITGANGAFSGLTVSASSTLGYASSTALTVSGNTFLTYASSTGISGTNLNFTNATTTALRTSTLGVGSDYLTDITGSGLSIVGGALTATGDGVSNWLYNGSRLSPSTTVGIGVFASSTIGGGTGATGLTIYGGATTTGNAYFGGDVNTSGTSTYQINGSIVAQASTTLGNYYFARAGRIAASGQNNLGIGVTALAGLTVGTNNTAVGHGTLSTTTSGSSASAFGYNALTAMTIGTQNTAMGYQSLAALTQGNNNVALGINAGYGFTSVNERSVVDNEMVFIGPFASRDSSVSSATQLTNGMAIGMMARVGASNSLALGGTGPYGVKVGIGSSTPSSLLTLSNSVSTAGNTPLFTIASTTGGTSTTTLMTVLASGNVGIGTSTPAQKLSIAGGMHLTGALYDRTYSAGTNGMVLQTTGTGVQWVATSSLGFAGADGVSNWLYNGSRLSPSTTVGIGVFASSTIGGGSQTTGLTIYGGATTTGSAYIAGTLGVGTPNTLGKFQIHEASGQADLYVTTNVNVGSANTTQLSFVSDLDGTPSYASLGQFNTAGLRLSGSGNLVTPDMMISSTGNVGIGTTSPSRKLTITGSGTTDPFNVASSSGTSMLLVTAAGNVGIGTTTPQYDIAIARASAATIGFRPTGAGGRLYAIGATDDTHPLGGGKFGIVDEAAGEVRFAIDSNGYAGFGTTTPTSRLTLDTASFSGAGVAGLKESYSFVNSVEDAVYYGNEMYITNTPTATSTLVGKMIRVADNSDLANTVRGLEVQAHRGSNTKGENTAISGFGNTFGLRGTTFATAGDTFVPAGVYAETEGTSQGNALRAYSGTITSEDLVLLYQDLSTFTGTGLEMDFGNGGGSFTGSSAKFLDLKVNGTSKFVINSDGHVGVSSSSPIAQLSLGGAGEAVANNYGLYVEDKTAGTNNWNIWSGPASTSLHSSMYTRGWFNAKNIFANIVTGAGGQQGTSILSESGNLFTYSLQVLGLATGTNATGASGMYVEGMATTSVTTSWVTGGEFGVLNYGTGAINEGVGIYIYSAAKNGSGAITTNYGLYVDAQTVGTNNWNIYSDGATTRNYFGGSVGIGTSTPLAKLSLASSTSLTGGIAFGPNIYLYQGDTNSLYLQGAFVASGLVYSGTALASPVLYGGFSASQNLTLDSTTDGTKGNIILAPSGGNVGIGTTTPTAQLSIAKSASGSLGPEILLNNTGGGVGDATALSFYSNHTARAQIRSTVESSPFSGNLAFSTGLSTLTERMRITGTGYVGIGTTSPNSKLQIYDNSVSNGNINQMLTLDAATMNFVSGGAGGGVTIAFRASAGTAYGGMVGAYGAATNVYGLGLWAATNSGAPQVFINNSGNVGVGTTSQVAKLHVASTTATGQTIVRLQDSNSTCDFTADAGGPTCGSDLTLKKDIEEIRSELSIVTGLRAVTYRWKTEDEDAPLQSGFIAQEVAELIPDLVTERIWIDGTKRKFLNTAGMMPYVVGAVGEMTMTIDELLSMGTSTMATTSPFYHLFDGEEDTLWEKLVRLGQNFVDGVLTLAGLKADEVETDLLCIGETCVDEATLKALLEGANQASAGSPSSGGTSGGTNTTTGTSTPTNGDTGSTTPETEAPPGDEGGSGDTPTETPPEEETGPAPEEETPPEAPIEETGEETEPAPPETNAEPEPEPEPAPEPEIETAGTETQIP